MEPRIDRSTGRGSRTARGAGFVFAVAGGALTGLSVVIYILAFLSGNPEAGWSIFILIPLVGFGILSLLTGGLILLIERIHRDRKSITEGADVGGTSADRSSTDTKTTAAVIGLVAAVVFPLAGLGCSLYAYFAGTPGTKGRRLGLAGVFLNLTTLIIYTVL